MRRMILGAAVVMVMAAGCGVRNDVQMGPEETVEAFQRAVAGGDFSKAMSLCDTIAMKEYIEQYAREWKVQAKKDSGATAIAVATLAEADFSFGKSIKDGDTRTISYTISIREDMTKKKTATVRKEEGVWKVEKITDSL